MYFQAEINDEFLACLDEPWPAEEEQASTSNSTVNITQVSVLVLDSEKKVCLGHSYGSLC